MNTQRINCRKHCSKGRRLLIVLSLVALMFFDLTKISGQSCTVCISTTTTKPGGWTCPGVPMCDVTANSTTCMWTTCYITYTCNAPGQVPHPYTHQACLSDLSCGPVMPCPPGQA